MTMYTSLSVVCAQSRLLALAACSRQPISRVDASTEKNQRFSNARFSEFCRFRRGPALVYAKANGLHDAEGVSSSGGEPGISSSDGGQWMESIFEDSNEVQCLKGEGRLKDDVRDHDAADVLKQQEDVAGKLDEEIPMMVSCKQTSERTNYFKFSGLPLSRGGPVEDLARVVESMGQSFLSVLDQQEAILHQRETLNGSDRNTHVEEINKLAVGSGVLGPTDRKGTSVSIDGGIVDEEAAPLGRRVESRKRTRKKEVQRTMTNRSSKKGDNVKFNEGTDLNINIDVDERFMTEALVEAKKAAMAGEVPVGAVIVQGGKITSRAYNRVESEGDATAHAEMLCIRSAAKRNGDWRLMDATLYVTLEPCPMCAGAILQSRVKEVVWGSRNTLLGADGSWVSLFPELVEEEIAGSSPMSESGCCMGQRVHPFHGSLAVRRGVLAGDCSEVMQTFFQARRKDKISFIKTKPWWIPLSGWVLFKGFLHWWSLLVRG